MVTTIISQRFTKGSVKFEAQNAAQMQYVETVKGKINSGEFQVVHTRCICGESRSTLISEVDRYGINLNSVVCSACGTVRFDPYLDEDSISRFYTDYYQLMYNRSTDEVSYFARQKLYGEKFLSIVKGLQSDSGLVVELGCGAGGALKVFMDNGYQVAGCDYDQRLLDFGKANGVANLYYGSLKDILPSLPNLKADVIFMNHVFEHVSNPEELLLECRSALNENGKIILSVPDILNVDKFDYFKGDILPMLHIAHKYNYSFYGLSLLAKKIGLMAKILYPDPSITTPTSVMPELWVEISNCHMAADNDIVLPVDVMERLVFLEESYKASKKQEPVKMQVPKKQSFLRKIMNTWK